MYGRISENVPVSDELFLDGNKSIPPEFMGGVPGLLLCVVLPQLQTGGNPSCTTRSEAVPGLAQRPDAQLRLRYFIGADAVN
jgi:hypothetical protein